MSWVYLYHLHYDLSVSAVDQSLSVFTIYKPQQKGLFPASKILLNKRQGSQKSGLGKGKVGMEEASKN